MQFAFQMDFKLSSRIFPPCRLDASSDGFGYEQYNLDEYMDTIIAMNDDESIRCMMAKQDFLNWLIDEKEYVAFPHQNAFADASAFILLLYLFFIACFIFLSGWICGYFVGKKKGKMIYNYSV